jgi:hypothetical protein
MLEDFKVRSKMATLMQRHRESTSGSYTQKYVFKLYNY